MKALLIISLAVLAFAPGARAQREPGNHPVAPFTFAVLDAADRPEVVSGRTIADRTIVDIAPAGGLAGGREAPHDRLTAAIHSVVAAHLDGMVDAVLAGNRLDFTGYFD